MKKLRHLLTVLLLLCSVVANAYDFEVDGIYYGITSSIDKTVEVTFWGYNSYNGSVVIPKSVTYNGVTYSVTSIGRYAFDGCSGLTSITIPYSVTSIGNYAFNGCDGLKEVHINDIAAWCNIDFEDIDANPMSYSDNLYLNGEILTDLVIPDGVTEIKDSFSGCPSLKSITIPYSVTSIGYGAFSGCSGLTSITIPNSVTSIGDNAFRNCSGLTSITIPYSVTSIGYGAFSGCSGLTSITIPNSVTSIGGYALEGCHNLERIELNCPSIGNWFTNKTSIKEVVIGNSVTSIGESAFEGCSGLTSVTIGNSVTSIGESAFEGCSGLTSITIPNSVTSIGSSAFYGCSGLTSITIPNSVIGIGNLAFAGCSKLTSVTIPNSVTSIESSTFFYCSGLTSVTIGNSVTSIGYNAFSGCSGLTSVTIPNGVTSIGLNAFSGCTGLTSITIPNSVTSIGNSAFSDCSGLTSITIPNSITSIGSGTFAGCTGLTSITIPNSITSIGVRAFEGCSGLISITIPNSITSIGGYAFEGCHNLKKVMNLSNLPLSKGSTDYGYVAYYATELKTCEQVDKFVFEKNTKTLIGYLGNDTHVVLPDKYNGASYSIGENAFANCSNILSVTIGTNIDAIDTYAFSGCNNIAKVFWLPNTPPAGYTTLNGKINYVANNKYTNLNNIVVTPNLSSKFELDGMVFIPTNLAARQCCLVDDVNDNLANIVVKDTVLYRNVALAVTDVMPYAFYNNDVVSTLTLNNSGDIGASAFYGNNALTALTFNNKGSIGTSAFEECVSLSSVNIPQEITSIGDHAFKGCKELTTARIEDRTTVLPLGKRLFDDTALQDLYIGAKISYINEVSHDASPFCENKTLKNVVITDIEDHIYDYEFYNCSALEKVTVGDGVEGIGKWAFSGCYSLSEFVFGSNVSVIGEEAFSDCTGITKITGRAVLPPVCGSQALDDINKWNCKLYVPSRNLSQYQNAEQWDQFLFIKDLETTDNYVTYMLEDEVYKVLLLTPGNRIIAPYVADREDGTPFSGWEMDEYIPGDAGANGIELKLNESMLYTNAPNTNTAWGEEFKDWTVLLDDNVETFFHSEYGGRQTPDGLDHYIRVDVGENMSIGEFTFTYTTRYNNNSVSPKTMIVEGSNSADGIYTEIATLTNLPGAANTVYTSQELGSNDVRFRYIRYRVTENSGGGLDNGHPFFAMSEFDMQGLLKNEGTASTIDYPVMPDRDITIKGYYTKSVYTLTYMVDGDVYKTFTLQQGDVIPTVDTPQKKGFVFSGWSEIPATMPAQDVKITGTFDLEKTGITDVTEISNNCLYHISQPHYSLGRTAWIVAAGGNALKTNGELSTDVDPYDVRQQFAIISKDGRTHYLYHVAMGMFVNKDGKLSATPKDVVLFKSGAYTRTFVMYFDNTHYININENKQLVINSNGTANGGNSCSIVAVTDSFDPTAALEKFDIPEDTGIRTIYYISTQRGSWAVETGGNALVSNSDLGIVAEQNDVRQQFAVLSINDVTHYLYHPAEKKFVNKDGSLSATPADAIYFKDGKFEDTYVAYFDNLHYVNIGGSNQMLVDDWNTPDEGNSCTFVSVGTFDAKTALAAINKFETAIEDVECEEKETVIYDLQGRRIKEITAPGIYIINGKKTIVR